MIVMAMSLLYTYLQFTSLISRGKVSFTGTGITNSDRNLNMTALNHSGTFVLGLANTSIDLDDNEFISIVAYELDHTYQLKKTIKLDKCTQE